MQDSPGSGASADPSADTESAVEDLKILLKEIAELLPAQGPISAFVFLNTLQGLEELPYDEAVAKGARLFGCEAYLSEERYHDEMLKGRFGEDELAEVLRQELGARGDEPVGPRGTLFELQLSMLGRRIRLGPPEELAWFIEETDALTKMRDDLEPDSKARFLQSSRQWLIRQLANAVNEIESPELAYIPVQLRRGDLHDADSWNAGQWEHFALDSLWRVCVHGATRSRVNGGKPVIPVRPRDLLLESTGSDADLLVNDVLVKVCAAFTDQGLAAWRLPNRELGLYHAFLELYSHPVVAERPWLAPLAAELAALRRNPDPVASLRESLNDLGISVEQRREFLTFTLLALRGWAGLIWQLEARGDRVALPAPCGSLMEFLAVRLILDRAAARHIALQSLGFTGPLSQLRESLRPPLADMPARSIERRALLMFQIAQLRGWTAGDLAELSQPQWERVVAEIESFDSFARRRILHLGYEQHFRVRALDAVSVHAATAARRIEQPRFQAVFCIDTREESFRRHLEEVCPEAETFAAAGFFGVPIYYKGVADAHFAALCPIVIRPQHWIVEDVVYTQEEVNRRRQRTRRALGSASRRVTEGTRGMASGAVLTAGLGVLASIPLVAGVLFPRLTSRIQSTAGRLVEPPPMTRLRLERTSESPGPENGG
ncbi:MAG: DUF2309 family protein, partial [Planctomycetaceae bacterium]